MNESVRIRLVKNDKLFPVDTLDRNGLTFRREADAWPRGVALEFDAANDITGLRLKWVRELKGWQPFEFQLTEFLDKGAIAFRGVDAQSFPGGTYWFRLRIGDLIVRGGKHRFTVDDDEQASCDVSVEEDPRYVVLKRPVDSWDSAIIAVLEASGQQLDGLSVLDWLASPDPRESRKACLLNLMAKLRSVPSEADPFIGQIKHIFLADVERIYAEVEPALRDRLSELAADPEQPFYFEGKPASADHLRLLERAATLTTVTEYTLESYRQEGRNSMQVVIAVPPAGDGRYFADIDIDLGNPLQDVQGFLIHMGELLSDKNTDHLKLHDALAKGATGKYLYYDVARR